MDLKEFKRVFEEFEFTIDDHYFIQDDSTSYLVDFYFSNGYHISFDLYGSYSCVQVSSGDYYSPPEYSESGSIEIDEIMFTDANEDNIDITPEIEAVIRKKVNEYFK